MPKKEFMTIPEAANYVNMPPGELETLIGDGKGPPVCHISKSTRRIKRTMLNEWMQSLMRTGSSQR